MDDKCTCYSEKRKLQRFLRSLVNSNLQKHLPVRVYGKNIREKYVKEDIIRNIADFDLSIIMITITMSNYRFFDSNNIIVGGRKRAIGTGDVFMRSRTLD